MATKLPNSSIASPYKITQIGLKIYHLATLFQIANITNSPKVAQAGNFSKITHRFLATLLKPKLNIFIHYSLLF
jgi:hypothetical protein